MTSKKCKPIITILTLGFIAATLLLIISVLQPVKTVYVEKIVEVKASVSSSAPKPLSEPVKGETVRTGGQN
jgi:hypothetical protein